MFELDSEEQQEIRASVRKLAEREIPAYQNENYYGTVPLELFQSFAELGLTGLAVHEDFGGIDASPSTMALIVEEIARVDLGPAIFLSVHSMVSGLISKFGNAQQKSRYLPDLASGKKLAAFCLSESSAGSDAGSLRTQAKKTADGFVLNGEKCWITSGGFADLYIVFARTSPDLGKKGISAFLVDSGTKGLSFGSPEKKMGAELSPICTMQFDNVLVPAQNLVGEIDNGYRIALGGLAGGRISIAACAVGLASCAVERSVKYLKQRIQFDQPLFEFQGLQFMLADMQMQLEASRMLTWRAARLLESEPQSTLNRYHPSVAKCFASDAAMQITTDAVQLFGAAGYVAEYGIEKLMRDAKMLQIVEGANQIQRGLIARHLESTVL